MFYYVNPAEDPKVVIRRVEISGRDSTRFDAKSGAVFLPEAKNMKEKVALDI